MERLTEWIDNGEDRQAVPKMDLRNNGHQRCCNKLAEYEDLEEQGLLLKLPCKVGDIVYKICPQSKFIEFGQMWDGEIVEHPCQKCPWRCCDCKDIGFHKDMDNIVQEVVAMNESWIIARRQYFGSIYFSTKEEAEAKLKEYQGVMKE